MTILKYRTYYYVFSGILIVLGVGGLLIWGLNFGIDFTGGSLLEVEFKESRLANDEVKDALKELDLGEITLQQTGERGLILRLRELDESTHQVILEKLGKEKVESRRFDSVGPAIGKELQKKALQALVFVLVAILIYIAWAFRRVSKPVSSVRYGIIALITLFHDILITVGIFSIISHFFNLEVGLPFVAAVLTVLGYSVNDTIVIFDRTRENLTRYGGDFEAVVEKSLKETVVRSFNISFAAFLVLPAIYFFGGETIRYFILTLIIGITIGTYSSIFVASPLLVSFYRRKFFFGV